MMVRAASKVAERYGVQALVTGEALGQDSGMVRAKSSVPISRARLIMCSLS
jgi:adenylyl- and sulfurtransferase ThiI